MARTKPKPAAAPVPAAAKWPAAEVTMRPVDSVRPRANNPRTHTPQQVQQIAASIREWGWTVPLLVDEAGELIAGHGRLMAAQQLGLQQVPVMVAKGWTDAQRRAYVIADNQLTLNGGWDAELLRVEVGTLSLDGSVSLDLLGFDAATLDGMLEGPGKPKGLDTADNFEPPKKLAVSRLGDLWTLDGHRVLCGDSTNAEHVGTLFGDELADLVHADPPYGMGKEADGVANDNLYDSKLDAFQVQWLAEALKHARETCSVYVWGNAPDLWRLWWGELNKRGDLLARAELVWAKGAAFGVNSGDMHTFPPETERCLFLMRGKQFLGNQNAADYSEAYEPFRLWLLSQRDAMGWKLGDVNRLTKTKMAGHWFGRSQFQPITAEHYDTLRTAAGGRAFVPTFDEVLQRFNAELAGGRDFRAKLQEDLRARRSYFDNTHEPMTDVWQFPRVAGVERFGHATPKPVAMMGRAVVSSCPEKGLVFEPFLGTGSTLIAAHLFNRRCFGMELEPLYVDVVVRRWQQQTGRAARLLSSGATFDETAAAREA